MSNAYVDRWDMLNNFCFHVYAEMSLFMGENVNESRPNLVDILDGHWFWVCRCRCRRCRCLNFFGIVIYTHKQQHLSIDMKTKIVQHVPTINLSI